MAVPIDGSVFVPTNIAADLFAAATAQSAALQLGRRVPMPAGRTSIPIPSAYPVAKWVNASVSRRKQWTDVAWTSQMLVAEELAAVFAIAQDYLDDATVDLWSIIRPMASSAMAVAIDSAVLFGDNAPASFPAGGVVGNLAQPIQTPTTPDFAGGVSDAMGQVEESGLIPTGNAARIGVRASLRNLRATTGELLFMPSLQAGMPDTLFGLPIAFTPGWTDPTVDLITGDWTKLVIGVRQDMTLEFSKEAVITDDTGKVIVNAFQDDSVICRLWMRLGCVLGKPVGPWGPTSPFAGVAPGAGTTRAASGAAPVDTTAAPADTTATKPTATTTKASA